LLIVATEEWTMRQTTKSPGEKIVKDIKLAKVAPKAFVA
jgi:transposase